MGNKRTIQHKTDSQSEASEITLVEGIDFFIKLYPFMRKILFQVEILY